MKLPIIINDNALFDRPGDLCVYDSVKAAELACEPPDADDPSINAFDIEGRALKIVKRDFSCVDLVAAEDTPTHGDIVEKLLRTFAERHLPEIECSGKSVEEVAWAIFQSNPNSYSGMPPQKPENT